MKSIERKLDADLNSIGIVLLSIAAAVLYGIVHDQITARICIKYFTIGHENIFGTADPTLLGLGWGVVATRWVGLPLGIGLAWAARHGARPIRTIGSLVRPLAMLLATTGCCAAIVGLFGWFAARADLISLVPDMAAAVPPAHRTPFLVDLCIHTTSYYVGAIGGVVVCALVARSRRFMAAEGVQKEISTTA